MQTLSRDQPQPPRACRNLMSEQRKPCPQSREASVEQQDTGSLERGAAPSPLPEPASRPQASLERTTVEAGLQQQRLSSPVCFISGLRVLTLLPHY